MFDIGFAELVIIAVVGLLVIGPERLPGAIRTVSLWINRLKRGFNDIKREVEQELHNDAVMEELRKSGKELGDEAQSLGQGLLDVENEFKESTLGDRAPATEEELRKKRQQQRRKQQQQRKKQQEVRLKEQEERLKDQERRLQQLEQGQSHPGSGSPTE